MTQKQPETGFWEGPARDVDPGSGREGESDRESELATVKSDLSSIHGPEMRVRGERWGLALSALLRAEARTLLGGTRPPPSGGAARMSCRLDVSPRAVRGRGVSCHRELPICSLEQG